MRFNFLRPLILLSVILSVCACKDSHNKQNEQLAKDASARLHSEDWEERENSLVLLSKIGEEGYKPDFAIQKELLHTLEDEIGKFKTFEDGLVKEGKTVNEIIKERNKRFPGGEYDDYIRMLSQFLAANKTEGGLRALFQLLVETNYKVPPALLTLFGRENLEFFIDKVNIGNKKEREIALSVLSIWSDDHIESEDFDTSAIPPLDPSEKDKLKPLFLKEADDPDYNIRDLALSGLKNFRQDNVVIKQIEQMADSDSEKFIRERARRILAIQKQ